MLTAVCPGCGARSSKVPDEYAGRTLRCKCGRQFQVPVPPPVAPAATAWEEEPAPPPPAPAATAWEDDPPPAAPPAAPAATAWEEPEAPAAPRAPAATAYEDDLAATGDRAVRPPAPTAESIGEDVTAPGVTEDRRPRRAAPAPGPGAAAEDAGDWQTGEVVLDTYEVRGVLGQGGMGRVYKVRHRGWDVDLAVKAPLASVLRAFGGADNFEREAETWVNLGLHPNIVSCYYVRRVEGVPRVFAEFVDGGSLHDWIRQRRLTQLDRILDIAIQFAWGLHYAHEQGLVHRDVKPANVMVTNDGVVKVTDFGLARGGSAAGAALAGGAPSGQTLVVAGGAAGTPAYMAPEQSAGQPLTRRTDLWSWALSVLEMFLGVRTWEYGVAGGEALAQFVEDGGKAVGLPALPPPVAELLGRCLRDDPQERPRSLWDAAAALYAPYEDAAAVPYPRTEPQAGRDTADSLNNRAVSLLDLARSTEAEPLWERALRTQPHHVEATYNQGLHGWTRGRLSDAELLTRMEEAAKSHGSSPRAHHLLGKLLGATGEYARAQKELEQAFTLGGATPELDRDLALALCAVAGGDAAVWRRAGERFSSALHAGYRTAADIAGYALCLQRLGRGEDARRFYEQGVEIRKDLPREPARGLALHVPGSETLRVLKGLPGPAVAAACDGGTLVGTDGQELRVWDLAAGATRTLPLKEPRLRAVALVPRAAQVLVVGDNAPLQLFDLSGRALHAFQRYPGTLSALALTPDGRRLVSGGSDRTVRVWEVATGRCLHTLEGHGEAVTCVAVSRDGRFAVSGSGDATVRVWDLGTAAAVHTFEGHKARVQAVAVAGADVLSGGDDLTVRHWSLEQKAPVRVQQAHTQPVSALAFCADARFALSAGADRAVRLWDVGRGQLVALARLDSPVSAVAAAASGRLAWAATRAGIAELLLPDRPRLPAHAVSRPVTASEAEQREAVFQRRLDDALEALRRGDFAAAVERAKAAREIPGYERAEAAIEAWDEITAALPRKGLQSAWETATLQGHRDPVLSVAVARDGVRVLSGSMDATVRLWDVRQGQTLSVLEGHAQAVTSVAFSPDGRYGFSGSWDRTVRVWDLDTASLARVLEGHGEYVAALAVSPEGSRLATASFDQTLRLWDVATGGVLHTLSGHDGNVSAVAFAPDGRFVASGGWDATVRAWDADTGECACVLSGHEENVTAVAVSPTGRQVASGGVDTVVRLWDLRNRRVLRALEGHTGEVTSLAFSSDGRRLASASRDKSVRIWDLGSGKCERALDHTAAVMSVAFDRTGTRLLTAGADQVVRAWHLDWEPEVRAAGPWDEKARPFLETFLSMHVRAHTVRAGGTVRAASGATVHAKAPTVRQAPAAGPGATSMTGALRAAAIDATAWKDADVDVLVEDLKKRGFGSVTRETIHAKLREMAAHTREGSSFWDEVRRAGPGPARPTVTEVAKKVPWKKIAAGGVVAVSFAIAGAVWFRPKPPLKLVATQVKEQMEAEEQVLYPIGPGGGDCPEPYDVYLGLARQEDATLSTLECVLRMRNDGTVSQFFTSMDLKHEEREKAFRKYRNAVTLMYGMGDAGVDSLCGHLGHPDPEVRNVSARALGWITSPRAAKCLVDTAQAPGDATARVSAVSALPAVIAQGRLGVPEGLALVQKLVADPDAAVRTQALEALLLFNEYYSLPVAERVAKKDDSAEVRQAAEQVAHRIREARKLEQLGY